MGWLTDILTGIGDKNKEKTRQMQAYTQQEDLKRRGVVSPLAEVPNPAPAIDIKGIFQKIMGAVQPKTASSPTPTPIPTAMPTPTPLPYKFDPTTVGITIPKEYTFTEPTGPLAEALKTYMPKEATQAATVAWAENAAHPYDPNGYNFNTPGDTRVTPGFEGSGDYGPYQINSATMQDYQKRFPNTMAKIGIVTVEDLKDPVKSTQFAKLIYDHQGWGAWKGWKNKGITGL